MSILFADDTALGASGDNLLELNEYVNTEFHKICTYFRLNKLSLHPDKTKFIVISNSAVANTFDFKIYISNSNTNYNDPLATKIEISKVTKADKIPAIKYLGVFFDPELNFKFHSKHLGGKLSRALFALRSVKKHSSCRCTLFAVLFTVS